MDITAEQIRDRIAAARNADELRSATAGVDPATLKASFKLFKSQPPADAVLEQAVEGGAADPQFASDALGRTYADEVFNTLAGANGRGTSRETGLPDGEQENFAADQGGDLVRPLTPYENRELGEAGSQPVRVGPNFMMSPQASGIAEPLDFKAPQPATVVKRAPRGIFRSVLAPDRGPSRTGNFFDPAPSDEKVAKSKGGGLFTSAVFGE